MIELLRDGLGSRAARVPPFLEGARGNSRLGNVQQMPKGSVFGSGLFLLGLAFGLRLGFWSF
jgi:hypothetical protein